MDIKNETRKEDILKGVDELSKGITKVKFRKNGEVNDVDTGHGWECQNESDVMTNLNWHGDKIYAGRVETKAGLASVQRGKRSRQDSNIFFLHNLSGCLSGIH